MGTEQQNAVGSKAHGKRTAALKRTHPKKSMKPAMVIGPTLDDDDDKKPHLSADEYRSMAGLKPRQSATTNAKHWVNEVLSLVKEAEAAYGRAYGDLIKTSAAYCSAASLMQQQIHAGMTQTQIAKALGKSQSWVSNVIGWYNKGGDMIISATNKSNATPFSDQGQKKRRAPTSPPDHDDAAEHDDQGQPEDTAVKVEADEAAEDDAADEAAKSLLDTAAEAFLYLKRVEETLDEIGPEHISQSVKEKLGESLFKSETFSHALRKRLVEQPTSGSDSDIPLIEHHSKPSVVQQALDLLCPKPTLQ